MLKQMQERRGSDEGFTLIELLIAIVVVGVLSTVVILGIGGLTDSGKTGACKASQDATQAALAVYYANTGGYPASIALMTGSTPPVLVLGNATAAGLTVTSAGNWHYTVTVAGVVGACTIL